jgi:hypothetical protein
MYIYALKLVNGKYYIGKTSKPKIRIDGHFKSIGSMWTKIYKPIKVMEIIPNCDHYDENKYTLKYMDQYGIENVRGGAFVSIKLDADTIKFIKQMSNGTNNRCFICGNEGHFANKCNINKLNDKIKYEDMAEEFI